MARLIGIVTPVLVNFSGYCALMKSLRGTTIYPYIVDNWSHNKGVAPSWNEGILACLEAGCSHVLVTNDDTVISHGGPDKLADRLDRNDDVILVSGRQQRGAPGYDNTIAGLEAMYPPPEYDPEVGDGDSPDFSCFMVTQRTIGKIGLFDENFKPGYFEDNDYHYRIHLEGYRTANLAGVPMYHMGSQTQNSKHLEKPVVTGEMFELNRRYYKEKWGGGPGEEVFTRPFNNPNRLTCEWYPADRVGY